MRKVGYAVVFSLCLVAFSGCNNAKNADSPSVTPTQPAVTVAVFESVGSKGTALSDAKEPESSQAVPEQNGKEQEEKAPRKEIVLQGLVETAELSLVENAVLYNAMNSMYSRNLDKWDSLFCVSPDTGIVYFVNQGDDYYLYRIKDGEVKLVIDLPVMELCMYEGNIYFMLNSYERYNLGDGNTGDIYCYTPADGKVTMLYQLQEEEKTKLHKLLVNEKGIYFKYSVSIEQLVDGETVRKSVSNYFYLPFGAEEAVEDTKQMVRPGTEDYYLHFKTDPADNKYKTAFISRTVGTEDAIFLLDRNAYDYCLVDNKLYYCCMSDTKVSVFDINTRELVQYDFYDAIEESFVERGIDKFMSLEEQVAAGNYVLVNSAAFTEQGKYLWAVCLGHIFCMDVETGEIIKHGSILNGKVEELYSDGKDLYVAYSVEETGVTKIARVLTEQVYSEESEANPLDENYFLTEELVP